MKYINQHTRIYLLISSTNLRNRKGTNIGQGKVMPPKYSDFITILDKCEYLNDNSPKHWISNILLKCKFLENDICN